MDHFTDFSTKNVSSSMENLLKQLQKAFAACKRHKENWDEVLNKCEPHVASVSTLFEIHWNCCNADIESTLLYANFPDIKERLAYTIYEELNNEIHQLRTYLKDLKKIHNAVNSTVQQTIKNYEERASDIPSEELIMKTELWPSLAEMLEWVLDIEKLFAESLYCKEFLIEDVDFSGKDKNEGFKQKWKNDKYLTTFLNETLTTLQFFLAAKL